MTSAEISALTLFDLEAIAARFSDAVKTIRDAQALLGGSAPPVVPRETIPAPQTKTDFTAAEQAERSRLLQQFKRGEVPDNIADAMGAEQ